MTTKQEIPWGLAPLDGLFGGSSPAGMTAYRATAGLPALERKVLEELSKERLVIEAQAEKTAFGITQIAEIHRHGNQVFTTTTGTMMENKQQARGKEHQAIADEFTTRQIGMFARHVMGTIDIGSTNIGVEVHRSLYPQPDPPERKGFLARIFG